MTENFQNDKAKLPFMNIKYLPYYQHFGGIHFCILDVASWYNEVILIFIKIYVSHKGFHV